MYRNSWTAKTTIPGGSRMPIAPHALIVRICSRLRTLAAGATFVFASVAAAQTQAAVDFDLPAQPLESSLRQIADSQKLQMIYVPSDLNGVQAPAVKGRYTPAQALAKVTEGTGLVASFNQNDTVVIKPKASEKKDGAPGGVSNAGPTLLAQAQSPSAGASEDLEERRQATAQKLEKVIVTGSRLPRIEEERAMPIVTLDRQAIERTGAATVLDLMRYVPQVSLNSVVTNVGTSTIQLRGLNVGTTLILINGRRVTVSGSQAAANYFDVNNIPIGAVERVEILANGASAVYGADALGGVFHFVFKRKFLRGQGGN